LWIATLLLLLVVTAAVIRYISRRQEPPPKSPPEPAFELLRFQPERMILSAGTGKALPVGIERHNGFRNAVRLEASNEGARLTVATTDIVPEGDSGELRLKVAENAAPGLDRVEVRATAEGQPEKTTVLQVVILPREFAPLGAEPPDEMPYPAKIVRPVGRREVVFVLIGNEGQGEAPYYLMENKVSSGVFRAFAEKNPQAVAGGPWKPGAVARDQNGDDDDELPVFGVTWPEAKHCAAWLGGRLPTARQLDVAFGFVAWLNGGRNAPAKPAVVEGRQRKPRKIGGRGDLSPFGIRDLAGNGREWTRNEIELKEGKRLAVLRGRSYTAPQLLSFAELEEWNNNRELWPVQLPEHRSRTTSFRVVIELPSLPRKQAAR
jgi:hypothetical protein